MGLTLKLKEMCLYMEAAKKALEPVANTKKDQQCFWDVKER